MYLWIEKELAKKQKAETLVARKKNLSQEFFCYFFKLRRSIRRKRNFFLRFEMLRNRK